MAGARQRKEEACSVICPWEMEVVHRDSFVRVDTWKRREKVEQHCRSFQSPVASSVRRESGQTRLDAWRTLDVLRVQLEGLTIKLDLRRSAAVKNVQLVGLPHSLRPPLASAALLDLQVRQRECTSVMSVLLVNLPTCRSRLRASSARLALQLRCQDRHGARAARLDL